MLLGFGGLSLLLAIIRNTIRRIVYHDSNSLDSVFDAGGRVTLGLTAVTVVSQLLWPADFLQTATNITKYGLGGSLFFSIGVVTGIQMFPLLSITLKTRAPGAKTFLQIVYARFGKPAHIMFCCVALFTNMIVIMALTIAAKTAIVGLVKDISDEMLLIILAVLFGSYCLIGGLGTTFYISYFNTALTFISVMVFVFSITTTDSDSPASTHHMYKALSCLKGPDGNSQNSYLTFRSRPSLLFGVILFFSQTTFNFCDQATWQSRIAAKPEQGAIGFILAAFLWFGISVTITLTSSFTYLSMSYQNGTELLGTNDIEKGFITPFVMEKLMGSSGAYLLITMLTMALMSTGSGEVMAISSIIVYDIYKVYIKPFRVFKSHTACILCGKEKTYLEESEQELDKQSDGIKHIKEANCTCVSADDCIACKQDLHYKKFSKQYVCGTHGSYRLYEDELLRHKSWCLLWITIAVVPFGLIIVNTKMNLTWACFALQAGIAAFVPPLFLVLIWSKLTSKGLIIGSACGIIADYTAILLSAHYGHEDGLTNFYINTSTDVSLFSGLATGVSVSLITTVIVSLYTYDGWLNGDAEKAWEATLTIDNPLNPWRKYYQKELAIFPANMKITSREMWQVFNKAKLIATFGFVLSVIIFIITIPAAMLSIDVLSERQFDTWLMVCKIWMVVCAIFAIFVPPIEEVYQIYKQYIKNKIGNGQEMTGILKRQF
ncbi:DUR3 [Mytilus coruscus]|uniref:DUR3 n=1 Tax=Mytilus coruscus TaxID=42192 RepID=A0A6J8ANK1_MYTCO|nr:DUR3 [Mytilus coruscus]